MNGPMDLRCSRELTNSLQTLSLSTPTPSNTFSLFPQLPPEIRLKIWALTILPRTVSFPKLDSTGISSPSPIPVILHTCRESRYEALRFYALSFGTVQAPPRVHFAANIDDLYIPRSRAMGYDETIRDFKNYLSHPAGLNGIQELALDYVDTSEKRPWEAYDKAVLIRSFPNLKRVSLVIYEKEDADRRRRGEWIKDVVFEDAIEHFQGRGWSETDATSRVSKMETEFKDAWILEEGIARECAINEGRGDVFEKWVLPELRVVGKKMARGYLRVL